MQKKSPLLQSCSSHFFRFISGTAGVKQVGKEEIAAFPEVLQQPDCSQMAGTLNNTQIIPSEDLTTIKSLQIYRMRIPGGNGCAVCVCFLKCNLEISVILSIHTSPFIVLLLNQSRFILLNFGSVNTISVFSVIFFFFSSLWDFHTYCSLVKEKPGHIYILTGRKKFMFIYNKKIAIVSNTSFLLGA